MSVVVDATLALWIVSVLNVFSNNIIFRVSGFKVLELKIEHVVDIVDWVHRVLTMEGSEKQFGSIFNIGEGTESIELLLNLIHMVDRWSNLIFVSRKRDQLVVETCQFRNFLAYLEKGIKISAQAFLCDVRILLHLGSELSKDFLSLNNGLFTQARNRNHFSIKSHLSYGSLIHGNVGDFLQEFPRISLEI